MMIKRFHSDTIRGSIPDNKTTKDFLDAMGKIQGI